MQNLLLQFLLFENSMLWKVVQGGENKVATVSAKQRALEDACQQNCCLEVYKVCTQHIFYPFALFLKKK